MVRMSRQGDCVNGQENALVWQSQGSCSELIRYLEELTHISLASSSFQVCHSRALSQCMEWKPPRGYNVDRDVQDIGEGIAKTAKSAHTTFLIRHDLLVIESMPW